MRRVNRSAFTWTLLLAALLAASFLLWVTWDPLMRLLSDWELLRDWVEELGPWGPLALIVLGVIQVLVAPLPGYPIVFVSGALFGGWWGAIYANLGVLIAGMTAAMLARTFGRPLVERFVEGTHLQRLERLLDSDSAWLWFFVLLLPTGDLPYFAAGLSRITMRSFFVALFAARIPFTFVLTHAAAHATTLPRETLLLLLIALAVLGVLAYSQQSRISRRIHQLLDRLPPSAMSRQNP